MTLNDAERFLRHVLVDDGCWLWTGSAKPTGYGRWWCPSEKRNVQAHRYAYELWVGAIPAGLEIDHICKTRNCVRPDHLRVTDRKGNMATASWPARERDLCVNGHALDGFNNRGSRFCRECGREACKRWRESQHVA